jgi:glycine betaine/proline transport system substrate-binding protein
MMKLRTLTAALLLTSGMNAFADDPSCATVNLTDPGWTDINATNGLMSVVLKGLGYTPNVQTLAVPIGFEGLKSGEIDIFLGNWMPAQSSFIEKYSKDNGIKVIKTNLTGAKFTLAVPSYVYEAGGKDFADLAQFKDQFDGKIYGIEAGAPANQLLQKMIDKGDFDLAEWSLVESGEQGVMSQVKRAVKREKFIVFLGWEPHPMNTQIKMNYLTGGDEYFGPDFGGATVQTVTRAGLIEDCPNLGKLLNNVSFTLTMENEVMNGILEDGKAPEEAALTWLKANPDILNQWLEGVTTLEGQSGLAAVKQSL